MKFSSLAEPVPVPTWKYHCLCSSLNSCFLSSWYQLHCLFPGKSSQAIFLVLCAVSITDLLHLRLYPLSYCVMLQPFNSALFTRPSHRLSHEGPSLCWQCGQPLPPLLPLSPTPRQYNVLFAFPDTVGKKPQNTKPHPYALFFSSPILIKLRLFAFQDRMIIFSMFLSCLIQWGNAFSSFCCAICISN